MRFGLLAQLKLWLASEIELVPSALRHPFRRHGLNSFYRQQQSCLVHRATKVDRFRERVALHLAPLPAKALCSITSQIDLTQAARNKLVLWKFLREHNDPP